VFIDKINGVKSNLGFKSIGYEVNKVGETVRKINYSYDYSDGDNKETCEIEIFRVKKLDNLNYKIDKNKIATIPLKPEGTSFNISELTNLDKDETFVYQIVRKDKNGNEIWRGADSGMKMYEIGNGEYGFRTTYDRRYRDIHYKPIDDNGNPKVIYNEKGEQIKDPTKGYQIDELGGHDGKSWDYTLVTQNGTTPLIQGAGYLAIPDTFRPGWRRRGFNEKNAGEIYFDADYQKKMEGMVKTQTNMYGGSMAGIESALPELKKIGVTRLFTTPIANGDNRTSHGYYGKNNMQPPENMGTSEDYDTLMMKELQHGIDHVYDITLTSEGIESIHANYARRWGEQAQTRRWFKFSGDKVNYGVLPREAKNVRHRLINAPFKYEVQSDGTYKKVTNDNYNPNKETLLQIYDASQVTDEQLKLDKEIDAYRELNAGKNLSITTTEDTVTSYVFEINPNEYAKNVNKINTLIKDGKKMELNSPDGTMIASNMSNFGITKTSEGYVAWDDNPDLIKINYGISAYDESELQAIPNLTQRQHERDLRIRASMETRDLKMQIGTYWAEKTRNAHLMYVASVIKDAKSAEKINKLVDEGKLPETFRTTQEVVDNILNGEYKLAPKGQLSGDDATVKALMQLPLDALEFGDNIVGILSTSYFSNRATTEDTIGMSRFELMKQGNPHLIDTYEKVYNKVNDMYNNELKEFAQDVIEKVNKSSNTPLIDSDGNYTEFGEYVIERVGRDIAKYALLKSLAGDAVKTKNYPDGRLMYDVEGIKNATTLKALGINANNPTEEAEVLQKKMLKGLRNLEEKDVDVVAKSITSRIQNFDTNTFRLAEGLYNTSGHGLGFRIDALKDNVDMDSVRNRVTHIDDAWSALIAFCKEFVQGIKKVNDHTYFVAEMTDVADVFKATYGGPDAVPYNGTTNVRGTKFNGEPDAMAKFYIETGITSEAAYSYFFTELLTNFSYDFERGTNHCDTYDKFKEKFDLLINTRSADFMKNLYTFIGNHDKTRAIQGLAIDNTLFQSTLMYSNDGFDYNHTQREKVIQTLSGAKTMNEVPLELRLNVDNLDYFRTVSARAVAQSKLLMDSVEEDLDGITTPENKKLIREALIDLANGNYMLSKTTENMTRIKLPELSSIDNAVREVAKLARQKGVVISDAEINTIIEKAKNLNIDDYLVRGDFNWSEPKEVGDKNKNYLREVMGTDAGSDEYSLYTVQIARMIMKASEGTSQAEGIKNALQNFVKIYNKAKISENMEGFKMYEDPSVARKKNSYAAHDFRTALDMAIEQAEFKSGKTITNKDDIIATVYNSVTEPAVKKHAMMLSFLSGLCGIPTIYSGDEYGDTGYEDKYKNRWVRNRITSRISEMVNGTKMGKIMGRNRDVAYDALKHKVGVKPLQNGTPYVMEVLTGGKTREYYQEKIAELEALCENLTKGSDLEKKLRAEQNLLKLELAKVAYMTQSPDGDIAISIFNAGGIDHNNRVNYFEKYGKHTKSEREQFLRENNIETMNPDNPYIPIQPKSELDAILMGAGVTIPLGTVFFNADARDKARYVVEKIGDRIGIVKEGGKKIIMDGITAKNGVMILRKALSFKGKGVYNKQYNFASNPYQQMPTQEQGKKLSIVAR